MYQLVQKVLEASRISTLDGFFGYNEIMVSLEDREKKCIYNSMGHIHVNHMPFGLTNDGATFQRAMDLAFVGKIKKFVVIYLDDLTVFFQF